MAAGDDAKQGAGVERAGPGRLASHADDSEQSAGQAPDAYEMTEEQRNIRNLIRVFCSFVAWPSLSLGLIFLLDPDDHWLHIGGLIPLGIAGLIGFALAPKLAVRWVHE